MCIDSSFITDVYLLLLSPHITKKNIIKFWRARDFTLFCCLSPPIVLIYRLEQNLRGERFQTVVNLQF